MPVRDIMTSNPKTVSFDTKVKELLSIFKDINIHHLLVVENNQLSGVISDRDVLRCVSPYVGTDAETEHDSYTTNKKAHQIMSRDPITVSPVDSLRSAATIIYEHSISCLPVVDANKKPVGIVTWRDFLKYSLGRKET